MALGMKRFMRLEMCSRKPYDGMSRGVADEKGIMVSGKAFAELP